VRNVVLKFSRRHANYIHTQPLHESQKVEEENDDHVIISLAIEDSPDLSRLLLGWGDEVEVLEPVDLRNEIKKLHEEGAERYRGSL